MLDRVGLNRWCVNRYPHEFSGGQRQRIGIARALVIEPSFIVCDEPISALDVSIQAQMVNMLEDLQSKMGLTYLFIAHDLSMVKHISTRIGVMYLGELVELAESGELYKKPFHPYTRSLLSSVPIPDPDEAARSRRIILEGEIPSPIDTPPGCKFRTRCPDVFSLCEENPVFSEITPKHFVACHRLK
jgi:oligopeptide transport system ATP-binding protein